MSNAPPNFALNKVFRTKMTKTFLKSLKFPPNACISKIKVVTFYAGFLVKRTLR